MTLDGTYAATVDRIEEGLAVLLVESDGETVAERHLPEADLPEGAGEGAGLQLEFDDGDLADVEYRPEATEERRERVREKFDRLSRRLGDDGDGDAGGDGDAKGDAG